ncbi:MAG: restriction endonuclease [Acidobacteriaceae bacterium]|nr:restriction endonuclease [Acidobacteriaceae bacterium]MBV9295282.1 restriction endonuclease [Acidobacteriaceae bacterium]MBV9766074.1 restriction endonuclease [Acidobacteriaceae bacterium]
MSWGIVVRHDGLGKVRVVTAPERDLLQARADAILATWEVEWQRKLAKRQSVEAKERAKRQRYLSKFEAEWSAEERTRSLQAEWHSLETLLKTTIEHTYIRDWELLKKTDKFAKARPRKEEPALVPLPAKPEPVPFKPKLVERLVGSIRRLRFEAQKNDYESKLQLWEAERASINARNETATRDREEQHKEALAQYAYEREQFESEQREWNDKVDQQRSLFFALNPDALLSYWNDLFSDQYYPEGWPDDVRLDYMPETKTLILDYQLPHIDLFPRIREVRYVSARTSFKETPVPESQRKKLYDETLYQIALASMYKVFQSDAVDALASVVFNGWVQSIDKATGALIRPCILSVQTTKHEFLSLNMSQVDARACFKKLKGVCGTRLYDISPVQPVLSLDKSDRRFVDYYGVADSLSDTTNLAAMDWQDFENLIRELFEKEFSQNGGEVKITQASRDGGVDAVAFDPDPIRGGKIVIQGKRYTNCVGVSAIRDLYGTVHNEGATKGILVTTADFGPDAYEFAKGKPLTLLSGSELLYLLTRHGYKARIDMAEAKRLATR